MELFLLMQAKHKTRVVQGQMENTLKVIKADLHEVSSQAESPR